MPLFKTLEPDDLQRLVDATRPVTYEPGTDIVEVGDPGHSLYIILEGEVQVLYPSRSQDFELARLSTGEFFGEMALLNDKPRSATVRAMGPVKALALDKEEFHRILLESPGVAVQLLEDLSVRLRNTDEQISGLSDEAMRDTLTGLLNRRAFHDRMVEECDRARRYGDHFSLILLDLDRFKTINDNWGHDVGDEVLSWIGRLLKEHTRAADAPFRVGGEEFAIMAPSTAGEVAYQVTERLVEVVAEANPPAEVNLRITMSAGYACCPTHGLQPDRLYQWADRALLRAKAEGRNRVSRPEEVAEVDPARTG